MSRNHVADTPKYRLAGSTDWLGRFPASTIQSVPFKAVYVFSSGWRFGFDLQGTEMNMNLFKRKTTLQIAACSEEHSLQCFALFGSWQEED